MTDHDPRKSFGLTERELATIEHLDAVRDNIAGPRRAARLRRQTKQILSQALYRCVIEMLSAGAKGTAASQQAQCAASGSVPRYSPRMNAPRAADRPTFIVELRAEPGVDAVRALRALLKSAIRRHGLRCVSIVERPR